MAFIPSQFRTVFLSQGDFNNRSEFHIEVDALNEQVRINGVLFSFHIFQFMASPNTERFYQMIRDREAVVFETYRRTNQLDNPSPADIVIRKL